MAAIAATLDVLEDGALDDPAAAPRFLANLRRATDQLEHRLQDLVTLARFETSALRDPEPTDLVELVSRAIEAHRPLAEARAVRVSRAPSARGELRVPADDAALSRAIENLLDGAIRASPGGSVVLSVDRLPDRAAVAIDVTNEPAAIPGHLRERLFERAALADAGPASPEDARAGGGSGLGRALARAAVEAHCGSVRFVALGPPRVAVRVELPT